MKVKIEKATKDGVILISRDGFILECPINPEQLCNNTCPAFIHHPKSSTDPEYIELKCFPNEVKFEVGEAK